MSKYGWIRCDYTWYVTFSNVTSNPTRKIILEFVQMGSTLFCTEINPKGALAGTGEGEKSRNNSEEKREREREG